jgi:FkbM family methyltransferase
VKDLFRHFAFRVYKIVARDNPLLKSIFHTRKLRKICFGTAAGCSFYSSLKEGLWMSLGLYEADGQKELLKKLTGRPDYVAVDAGSYIGFFSLIIANILRQKGGGTLYAFDPNPINIASLQKTALANPSLNIIPICKALGSYSGNILGFNNSDNSMSSLGELIKGNNQANFEVVTLDSMLASKVFNRVDFVKIDVDGFEWELLCGAKELIKNFRPRILIELHSYDLALSIYDFLKSHHYKFTDLEGTNISREYLKHVKYAFDLWCEPDAI